MSLATATRVTECTHGLTTYGFGGNSYVPGRPRVDGCGCPCGACRPYLTDAEVADLNRRLDPLANALVVVVMTHLTAEAVAS